MDNDLFRTRADHIRCELHHVRPLPAGLIRGAIEALLLDEVERVTADGETIRADAARWLYAAMDHVDNGRPEEALNALAVQRLGDSFRAALPPEAAALTAGTIAAALDRRRRGRSSPTGQAETHSDVHARPIAPSARKMGQSDDGIATTL